MEKLASFPFWQFLAKGQGSGLPEGDRPMIPPLFFSGQRAGTRLGDQRGPFEALSC